jgi:phage terminase large subunit GpA-like protein
MERWLIDRFEIHQPPADAPGAGTRAIDPGRYAEDWAALMVLAERVWPVQGAGHGLRATAIGVDSGGAPGVTDNAYRFWRERRRDGAAALWRLIRPRGGLLVERAWLERPKGGSRGRKAASDIPLLHLGVDRLKDAVAAQLGREADGAGAYHLSGLLPSEVFDEFAAERRTAKGWELKRGVSRNEAFDLGVYNLGLALILKADRIDWDRPPGWALEGPENANAVAAGDSGRAAAPSAEPAAAATRPAAPPGGWIPRKGRWL